MFAPGVPGTNFSFYSSGPIGIILGWFGGSYPNTVPALDWIGFALICFILPAVLTLIFSEILYKIKWIKPGDLKLDL